jgi:hypothetical protein
MSLHYWLFTPKKYLVNGEECNFVYIEESEYLNITHNLNRMAEAVQIEYFNLYELLWYPIENLHLQANKEYITKLEKCYNELKNNPDKYEKYNSPNGWGLYEHFVPFVKKVLDLCKENEGWYINTSK